MRHHKWLVVALVVGLLFFLFFVPIVPISTTDTPYCALHRGECPGPLFASPMFQPRPIYYSVTAYTMSFGAYYGPNYGYGYGLILYNQAVCLSCPTNTSTTSKTATMNSIT
jgi:hypothetical protein